MAQDFAKPLPTLTRNISWPIHHSSRRCCGSSPGFEVSAAARSIWLLAGTILVVIATSLVFATQLDVGPGFDFGTRHRQFSSKRRDLSLKTRPVSVATPLGSRFFEPTRAKKLNPPRYPTATCPKPAATHSPEAATWRSGERHLAGPTTLSA